MIFFAFSVTLCVCASAVPMFCCAGQQFYQQAIARRMPAHSLHRQTGEKHIFTTFLCTKLNKLCICDIVISNICLILHSYDVSCCKCTMYDTLDSSPLEKVKLFWQRFQHKLFVFFKDVPLLRYCILKQTWEELQLYLSDHARQFLNLGY